MFGILENFFPSYKNSIFYDSHEQYLLDMIKQIEILISYYSVKVEKELIGVDNFKADNLTEKNLSSENYELKKKHEMCKLDYEDAGRIIKRKKEKIADKKTGIFIAFDYLCDMFTVNELEKICLLLALMPVINKKEENRIEYVQAKKGRFVPTYDLAIDLYAFLIGKDELDDYLKVKRELIEKMSMLFLDIYSEDELRVSPSIYNFIVTNGKSFGGNPGTEVYYPSFPQELPIMDDIAQNIYNFYSSFDRNETVYYYISGKRTSGKRTQVKRFADLSDKCMIFQDARYALYEPDTFETILVNACRMTIIQRGIICITNLDALQSSENDHMTQILMILNKTHVYSDQVFLLSESETCLPEMVEGRFFVNVPMRLPTLDESVYLWGDGMKDIKFADDMTPFDAANKFNYTPGQITQAIFEAKNLNMWKMGEPITNREFYSCVYRQTSHSLKEKADLVYAKHSWNGLILPEKEKRMLKSACNQMRYKHIVYNQWGMNKRISYGRGISMLFAGLPGTGKTMAAQVVANDLGIEMYKVNLSQIVSKYIGETEKNLNELFKEASKTSVILFFDETDALLGKRTEVKDARDKSANMETSYLLQKMEEYEGITVMTTNYLENIDSAFFRRISYVIHFPFPDVASREKIWRQMFPEEMPLDTEIDFEYLANQFEIAGGNIKNTVVSAAFLAAQENEPISMPHILLALKYEMAKQGKNMFRDDFGEYSYMVEEGD